MLFNLALACATEAPFPIQLLQANACLTHLFKSGLKPENLQLAGDSAGGNLILQLFSHALHGYPDPAFPPSPLAPILTRTMNPIKGALLISPWVNLSAEGGSFEENSDVDVISKETWRYLGSTVLSSIPHDKWDYIEFRQSPLNWFDGVQRLVDRMMVIAGKRECSRDDIVKLAEVGLGSHHNNVKLMVQEGIHDDAIFSFSGKDLKGDVTTDLAAFLVAGYAS